MNWSNLFYVFSLEYLNIFYILQHRSLKYDWIIRKTRAKILYVWLNLGSFQSLVEDNGISIALSETWAYSLLVI